MMNEPRLESGAVAPPQYPTIQQTLRQLLTATTVEATFLALRNTQSDEAQREGPFSIVAWYPSMEQRARLMSSRWIREAIAHTLETSRTILTAGRWRITPDHPKRSALLISTPVFNGDNALCGALAILAPPARADSEVIALLERGARQITEALARLSRPAVPSSPLHAQPYSLSAHNNRVLTHELRVPLGAASYALEALLRRPTFHLESEEDERLIRIVQLGLTEAQDIVRSASQAQATGDSAPAPSIHAIRVETALARARDLFPAAHDRLQMNINDDLPAVRADELRLTQTLTNLLENALKYSWPDTLITVSAQPHGADRVQITVHSFGGDAPSDQWALIERATRDTSPPGQAGKGIGLSIARDFIKAMDGEFQVKRDEYGAIKVILTLPIAFI